MDTGEMALDYRPTHDDYRTALRAWTFGTWPGRRELVLPPVMALAGVVVYAWLRGFDPGITGIASGVVFLVAVTGTVRARRRIARQSYADVEPYGDCRTVLGEAGVTTTGTGPGRSSVDWQALAGYCETPELFVLTVRRGRAVLALPKRGTSGPAEAARVRALLDGKLRRF
ncbi:YcxB family protein [Streptomyces sp. NPDC002812]|uniref:YcxB family protein n=1 Tax=unclassified Streptomyces TaxID=2593676 RepID=UPI002257C163|nr:YcxB family protein [Streptomyces sp. NBC_00193]MCX5298513.1 YcxB family protein [Streptomyces sp. NBC_00193]